jgi:hypothetical protein
MKRLQFSIVMLLGLVTLVGLGCAALVNASHLWASICVNVAVLTLMAMTVGAVYLRSRWREFCGGFAIFGWTYLLLAMTALTSVERWLLTGAANDYLYSALGESTTLPVSIAPGYAPPINAAVRVQPNPVLPAPAPPSAAYYYAATYNPQVINSVPYDAFGAIAHSLWTLLAGLTGGVLASWFVGRAIARAEPAD